jgi:hypothetical protein
MQEHGCATLEDTFLQLCRRYIASLDLPLLLALKILNRDAEPGKKKHSGAHASGSLHRPAGVPDPQIRVTAHFFYSLYAFLHSYFVASELLLQGGDSKLTRGFLVNTFFLALALFWRRFTSLRKDYRTVLLAVSILCAICDR